MIIQSQVYTFIIILLVAIFFFTFFKLIRLLKGFKSRPGLYVYQSNSHLIFFLLKVTLLNNTFLTKMKFDFREFGLRIIVNSLFMISK